MTGADIELDRQVKALSEIPPRVAHLLPADGVRNNVSGIFTKLQVADRAQAIIRGRSAGLGRQPHDPT